MDGMKKNIEYINLASVISAIAVVFLHANDCFWRFSSTERYWVTANIIECVFYFAVPVFFMISGVTLLDFNKRYGLKQYFFKRIDKTLIPYLFWSFLGLGFQIYLMKSIDVSVVNTKYIINGLLSGSLVSVYWFFIPLFCVYLSIPLFAAVPDESRKNIYGYLVIITFFINCLVPFIINIFNISISYTISVVVGESYLIYILIGYLVDQYVLPKSFRYMIYILSIMGLLMHIIGTYNLSIEEREIVKLFKGYVNVPCVLYSTGVFVFLRYSGEKIMKNHFFRKMINFLKSYTFSLYLMHWFILQVILRAFSLDIRSIYYRLLSPFVVVIINILITYFLRKLPFFGKLLP